MQIPSGNALHDIAGGAAAHRPSEQVRASNASAEQAQSVVNSASRSPGQPMRVDLAEATTQARGAYPPPRGSILDIIV